MRKGQLMERIVGMSMSIKLNKDFDSTKIFPSFGSVGFMTEDGEEIRFDFQDVHSSIDEEDDRVINIEYENPLYDLFPKMEDLDVCKIDSVCDVYYGLGTDDEELLPEEIVSLSIIVEEELPEELKKIAPEDCNVAISNVIIPPSMFESVNFVYSE